MDSSLVAISAHSLERIIAVLLGGLAVYYGFRLFLVVPFETHSDGSIQLPGASVVLSKAGPGIFFAAFGALVVATSLMRPITVGGDAVYQGVTESVSPSVQPQRPAAQTQTPGTQQALERTRIAAQTLNCMQRLSSQRSKGIAAQETESAVREAKLALLHGVWNTTEWGDFDSFKQWAVGRTVSTNSPAKSIFEAERSDCPR